MFHIKVNRQLLLLKICYFLMFACLGPIIGFMPTIARQLGYSITTYGSTMTAMSIISTIWIPLSGMVIDKFRITKIFFITTIFGVGLMAVLFMFVPKVPLDSVVEFHCDANTTDFTVYSEKDQRITRTNDEISVIRPSDDDLITCKFSCFYDRRFDDEEMIELKNQCGNWMIESADGVKCLDKYRSFDVNFKLNDTERIKNSYVFHVLSVQYNNTPLSCQCRIKTLCRVNNCSNEAVMDVVTPTTYRGNVLNLYQFWIFIMVVATFWGCIMTASTIVNPICLDILGDKSEDYGKQKCWASIGWGSFSILLGWIVDLISMNKKDKDYSAVFYSCIILTILNLLVTAKIKVTETKKTDGRLKSVYLLFFKDYVIAFFAWCTINSLLHTIITHFLLWYMEDMVSANHDASQRAWIKTLQGLAQGVQCFGGEIPFFFWSGYIIRKLGHINCMAVVLGAMAIRMYLYTVIWNPAWIILIELLNGVSYALGFAVKMSYAKLMSPPESTNTIISFIVFFECIGESIGSIFGGYIFDSYGGVWAFRFFAYSSAFMCCLNIVTNYFEITKELNISDVNILSAKTTDARESDINDKKL